jgi:hypothetical protein
VEAAGGVWLAVADDQEAVEWLRRTNLAAVPVARLSQRPGLMSAFWTAFHSQDRGKSAETKKLRQQLHSRRASHWLVAHCPTEMDPQWHEQAARVRLDAILVLPAWDCRSFRPLPEGGASELNSLRHLQRAAPDGYGACGVWSPSVETLEQLRSRSRSTRVESFAVAIQHSLANDIQLLPVERDAPPQERVESPNELRRQLYAAQTFEEFDDVKRRFRAAIEESLLDPATTDGDSVGAQRRHVGNLVLQQLVDVELEIALSRDRHPFSSSDRSETIPNFCKLAQTWLGVYSARTGGRNARRRR